MASEMCNGKSIELLIAEVKKYPQLYDIWNPLYKHTNRRLKAWKAVSTAVKLNVNDCQKKWKTLRDRFVREKKKFEQSVNSGITLPPIWHLYQYMSFLLPFVTTKRIHSSSNEEIEEPGREDSQNLLPELQFLEEESDVSYSDSPSSPSVQAPQKKRKTDSDSVEQAILDMAASSCETKDECHHLMEYSCCILRTLDEEKGIKASKKILDIIFEARMEK